MLIILFIFNLFLFNSCSSEESSPKVEIQSQSFKDIAKLSKIEEIAKKNDEIYNSRNNSITNAVRIASDAVVGINVTETKRVVYRDQLRPTAIRP